MAGELLDFENEETEDYSEDTSTDIGTEQGDDDVDLREALDAGDYFTEDEDSEEEPTEDEDSEEDSEHDEAQEDVSDDDASAQDFKNEENARNAQRRREQEQRAALESTPEFQMVKQLEKLYGKPLAELQQDMLEAQLQQASLQTNVPIDFLRAQHQQAQELEALRQRVEWADFQAWHTKADSELTSLAKEFPMLSNEELGGAKAYVLETLQNPSVPMKSAIMAMYGDKILEGLKESARNESLAEVSGRKQKSTLPPKAGKAKSGAGQLSAAERAVAKVFGLSDADYLKNRI